MKFALIGNGNIAPQYISAFRQYTDDIVLCSRTHKESDYPQTADFKAQEILSADVICIATPPYLHFEMAKFYLDHGKKVILEKPAVTSYSDLNKLLSHPQKNNLYFAYHSAFNPLVLDVFSRFKVSGLHEIEVNYSEDVFFYHPDRSGWLFNQKLSGGGCLADSGINIFSILYKFIPKLEFVSGFLTQNQLNVEDSLELSLRTPSGIVVNVSMDWLSQSEKRAFTLRGVDELSFNLASNEILFNGNQSESSSIEIEKVDQNAEYKNLLADALHYFETGKTKLGYDPELPLQTVFDIYQKADYFQMGNDANSPFRGRHLLVLSCGIALTKKRRLSLVKPETSKFSKAKSWSAIPRKPKKINVGHTNGTLSVINVVMK